MTNLTEMRDLAHRLLAYEAGASKAAEPIESAALRVFEKLRLSLIAFSGVAGFHTLASRALALASAESPALKTVQISADGFLLGTAEGKSHIGTRRDGTDEYPAGDGGTILIAHLLGLLHIFLGEALTLSLLRDAWPGATFDDRNSGNGRES